jgi:protein involved in polysaccharide export with SLBB domain
MLKRLVFIIILFASLSSYGQDINELRNKVSNSSDSELIVFIQKAKDQGLSLVDAEKQLILIGAKAEEIKKLRNLWDKKLPKSNSEDIYDSDEIKSQFGETEGFSKSSLDIKDYKIKRFGSNFFENKNISEAPQLFIATPSDYRLGPGDELIVNLFGASENSYSLEISRNGTVKLDRLAPIYLSGLSIPSAKSRLKNRLSKLYAGLVSNDQLSRVDIDVSLQKARSIVINITGQVTAPGTYTISGFSSVLNALFAAGGPNEIGSFRNIKLLRNGKVSKTIDLYDYFVRGVYPNVYLRDQDVILVSAFNKQVEVNSGLKTNALYEINENETVKDLLSFAGGFSSNSYKDKLFVNRISSFSRSIVEVVKEDFSEFKLKDGDILNAKEVSDLVTNSVSIEGSVFIPGFYDLTKVSTVGDLISFAKGLMPDASSSLILYRTNMGVENQIISLNISDKKSLNIKLLDQDRLVVFSNKDIETQNQITIIGEVNNPNKFDYKSGITVRDIIQLANGFSDYANKSNIKIIRNISTENTQKITEEFIIDFSDELNYNNINLLPDDIIAVSKISYLQPTESYSVKGQVSVENTYSISSKNYSINDAFKDNIRLTSNSSVSGIYIQRDSIKIPVSGKKVSPTIFEPKSTLELQLGDIIFVPKKNNTIIISGGVQSESIISYEKSLTFRTVINYSGGYLQNAARNRVYIEYQNGLKKSVKSFLGLRFYPKVLAGSKIYVPEKTETKSKTSVGEIVGYTTSLVSIIALIKSL